MPPMGLVGSCLAVTAKYEWEEADGSVDLVVEVVHETGEGL